MSGLSSAEKVRIAQSGGQFQEVGPNSWVGKKIRKGKKLGVVIEDLNGIRRVLRVRFEDGSEECIEMNNIGPDPHPEILHQYEFLSGERWYRF